MEYLNAISQSNKLILDISVVVIVKCAADKTIDAVHTASTDCKY